MSKVGQDILRSVDELTRYARGEAVDVVERTIRVPETVDVKAVRAATGLSQQAFARRYGIAIATLRDWEQGRRKPPVHARAYLTVIARNKSAVDDALAV